MKLSVWKKLVFGLVALALALMSFEAMLAWCGIQPQLYEKDPYVGFSGDSSLFVEESGTDGQKWMITAKNRLEFFNPQRFLKQKPSGNFRVFSMGGSTTYGHPYTDSTSFSGWLREYLGSMEPGHPWEVINAGGISYGSVRVAHLMEELIQYQPDLFVIYCGHNEFLEKRIYKQIDHLPQFKGVSKIVWRLRTAAAMQKLLSPLRRLDNHEQAVQSTLQSDPVTLLDNSLGPSAYQRDEAQREQIFRHYRFNIQRMIAIARSVGARVIFVDPASNLRDTSPFKSEHARSLSEANRQRWKQLYDQARADFMTAVPTNALVALDEAETIDPLPANLHFVRGRVQEKLGHFAEAKSAYVRARDEDICPLRAPSEISLILHEVSREERVPLIEFVEFVAEHSDHGIAGGSLFLDHVHLTVEGYRLLSLEILKTIERDGLARLNWDAQTIEQITKRVTSGIDARKQSLALMNLCKTLGWAGKREEAYRAGKRAVEIGPEIAEVQYQTGLAAQLFGRTNEAVLHYRQAVSLKPDLAKAHCALGVVLEDRGEIDTAIAEFRLALQFGSPKDVVRDRQNLESAERKRTVIRSPQAEVSNPTN